MLLKACLSISLALPCLFLVFTCDRRVEMAVGLQRSMGSKWSKGSKRNKADLRKFMRGWRS